MLRELDISVVSSVSPIVLSLHIDDRNGHSNPGRNVFPYFTEEELEVEVIK